MLEISVPSDNYNSQRVKLDGVYYTLTIRWNARGGYYAISIDNVLYGIPIIMGLSIFYGYDLVGLPKGTLFTYRNSGSLDDIQEGELGSTVRLLYAGVDE